MGAGASQIDENRIEILLQETKFTRKQIDNLVKRYQQLYQPGADEAQPLQAETIIKLVPEFRNNSFITLLARLYSDTDHVINAERFVRMCSVLSSKTELAVKQNVLFKSCDTNRRGFLSHHEMFTLYKVLFHRSLSDDQILDVICNALQYKDVRDVKITQQQFNKLIHPSEVLECLTVELQKV